MAFLSPRAGSPELTVSSTSDSTSFAITLSAHEAGDYLVAIIASDGSPALSCTGWTQVKAQNNSTNNKLFVFLRDTAAASSSETNPTFTSDGAQQYAAAAYSIPASVFNIDAGATTGVSATADCPSFTPLGGTQDYLWITAVSFNNGATTVSGFPSGYSDTGSDGNGGSGGCVVAVAQKQATASSENPGAFANDNIQWAAATVAIWGAPPSGGGGSSSYRATLALMGV